mmetsp:Transcript_23062/g.49059  ORF Transcript_23062/g.49059 Transcript_23062/m.49059 type:complete len:314 (-) Transcript_23062:27-968(-)
MFNRQMCTATIASGLKICLFHLQLFCGVLRAGLHEIAHLLTDPSSARTNVNLRYQIWLITVAVDVKEHVALGWFALEDFVLLSTLVLSAIRAHRDLGPFCTNSAHCVLPLLPTANAPRLVLFLCHRAVALLHGLGLHALALLAVACLHRLVSLFTCLCLLGLLVKCCDLDYAGVELGHALVLGALRASVSWLVLLLASRVQVRVLAEEAVCRAHVVDHGLHRGHGDTLERFVLPQHGQDAVFSVCPCVALVELLLLTHGFGVRFRGHEGADARGDDLRKKRDVALPAPRDALLLRTRVQHLQIGGVYEEEQLA